MNKKITLPFSNSVIRELKCGDHLLLSGIIYTARDRVHRTLIEKDIKLPELKNGLIYHCGPIILENKKSDFEIMAAGPTTSIRMETYEAELIEKYGIKAVMGKGGMGPKTVEAMQKHGAIYLQSIGGAAQILASKIVKIHDVLFLKEFGSIEAMWKIEVKDFPAIVAIDSRGNSIYRDMAEKSLQILNSVLEKK